MEHRTPTITQQHLLSLVEKYATRFFAAIIALLCVLMFYFGPKIAPDYKDVFISVSTSLFASLIFALIYSSIVDRHHLTVVSNELARNVERAVEEMKNLQQDNVQKITDVTSTKIEEIEKSFFHEISHHFRELIPADHFPSTEQPDQHFNNTLNGTLAKSRFYLFKGVTGRYIPGRLSGVAQHNLTCRILLIDPANVDLLQLYVRDRFGNTTSIAEVSKRVETVRQEIYMTIVDLFDQARRTSVEIKLYNGPIFYRTEIFDEKMFISFFTVKTSTAFPTTYLYTKDSFFYNAFLTDFNQTFELATIAKTFNSN